MDARGFVKSQIRGRIPAFMEYFSKRSMNAKIKVSLKHRERVEVNNPLNIRRNFQFVLRPSQNFG